MTRKIVTPEANPALNQTYSQAVQVGDLIFTSGQIGFDPVEKKLVEGGIQAQTRQCLENIRSILEAANSSMADVVKMTVFVARAQDFGSMNEVYGKYFQGYDPPAKTAVIIADLAIGALVEMDAIATVK